MPRRIPNFNQIRAFEAAARLGSFREAGDELNVTYSAISHQIKALEAYFGAPLFRRKARGVEITDAARPLLDDIQRALDVLESATANFQASELGGTLTVSIAPSFASRWLLKRLGKFRALYPTIAIEPEIASNLLDFGRSHIDVAIRHGSGEWPGLNAEKLFDETLWMVGSPQVANTILGQDGTIDFAKAVLLTASVRTGELKIWLDESGSGGPEGREVIHYPTQALALDGAVSGLGVALADYRIVEDEIKEGRLVQVTDQTVQTGRGYYLVWPKGQALDAKSHAFMTWLAEEISRHANGYS